MLSALLAATFAFTPADADIAYETARALVEEHTPRDSGTFQSRRAAIFIKDAASAAGLDANIDTFEAATPAGRRVFANVVGVFLRDRSLPWVVFVSHFDTKTGSKCPGANDGASTTGLLVALANAVSTDRPERVNVMFVWTDGEECMERYCSKDGLWGARRVAKAFKRRGMNVRAVVCLDMLGDRDLHIRIPQNTSSAFRRGALKLAAAMGLGDIVTEMSELVKDDHAPFLEEGYKSLLLIDFDYGSRPGSNDYWHSAHDTMDKISRESLLVSGRFAAAILKGLDK